MTDRIPATHMNNFGLTLSDMFIMEQVEEYISGKSDVMVENTTRIRAGMARPIFPIISRIRIPGSVLPVTMVAINPIIYIHEDTIKYPHHVFQKADLVFFEKRE